MLRNLTGTEKLLLLLAAVFLAVIAGMSLQGDPDSDYTVTAQYALAADQSGTGQS